VRNSSTPKPRRQFKPGRPATHLLLYMATVFSVFLATHPSNPFAFFGTSNCIDRLAFTCAIMGILTAHELGHYIAGRLHGIELTLPYFIPVPFAFGTMGAVIRMKQISKKNALLDVGAAGPLAGIAVALPLALAGIALSEVQLIPVNQPSLMLGDSLLFKALVTLIHGDIPEGQDLFLHPIGLAAWFGFLITALNLMPAGQLDGGHVVKALSHRHHLLISRTIFMMLSIWGAMGDALLVNPWLAVTGVCYIVGAITLIATPRFDKVGRKLLLTLFLAHLGLVMFLAADTVSFPWLLWSLLLYSFRLEHPPIQDPEAPLSRERSLAGCITMGIFFLTFMPLPISIMY
jgi:membrane-associated protease RseP (regulator of RpoE activity)